MTAYKAWVIAEQTKVNLKQSLSRTTVVVVARGMTTKKKKNDDHEIVDHVVKNDTPAIDEGEHSFSDHRINTTTDETTRIFGDNNVINSNSNSKNYYRRRSSYQHNNTNENTNTISTTNKQQHQHHRKSSTSSRFIGGNNNDTSSGSRGGGGSGSFRNRSRNRNRNRLLLLPIWITITIAAISLAVCSVVYMNVTMVLQSLQQEQNEGRLSRATSQLLNNDNGGGKGSNNIIIIDKNKKKESLRSLDAMPGYYQMYSNNSITPPKVYLYDTHKLYDDCLSKFQNNNNKELYKFQYEYKHGGEVWFQKQIQFSPWRTLNPNEADLFVLPLLPGFSLHTNQQKQDNILKRSKNKSDDSNNNNDDTNNDEYGSCLLEMLLTLDRIAQTSPYFQKNEGRDHILLSTDYLSHRKTINWCPKCIHFHQGNSDEIQKSLQLTEFAKKQIQQQQQQQRDPSDSSNGNHKFYDYIKDYYFNDYGGGIGNSEQTTLLSAPMFPQLYLNRLPHQTKITPKQTLELRNQNTTTFLQKRKRAFYFAGQADKRRAYNSRRQIQLAWNTLSNEQYQILQNHFSNVNNTGTDTDDYCGGIIDNFVFVLKGGGGGGGNKNNHGTPAADNTINDTDSSSSSSSSIGNCDHHRDNKEISFNFTHDVSTTRFGLQARGDNPTSSRLYEWIDVGSIPVIVIDDAWLPGRHIPWNQMSIRISESLGDEELKNEFRRIAYELPHEEITKLRTVLQLYAPAILWSDSSSVVAEVLLVDAWEVYQQQQ
ncbi:MAG: hypothetical protein ACI90V_003832 [Bacillariaceae sp.]